MKVVILCGGLGTRLREETEFRPKPMVPVGNRPMLWHIMKIYAHHGHKDFILCLGYKGEIIKDYFLNYKWNTSDVQLNLGATPKVTYLTNHNEEDWKVTMVDTGAETMTGGRIRRVLPYIDSDTFLATYGDGVSDCDINGAVDFHKKHGKLATLTAVQLAARFGDVVVSGSRVTAFKEKTKDYSQFINGGFFVFDKRIGDYLKDDSTVLEQEPLTRMAAEGEIHAYQHKGFWQCMDTYREQQMLDKMYVTGQAPLESVVMFANAYNHKTVWLSGHTGFKGAWLAEWLLALGAKIHGFSLQPPTDPSMFEQLGLAGRLEHETGDVRDLEAVRRSIEKAKPDYVFHLAAQPLVREAYAHPVETFATNVQGTVHVLEALRTIKHSCAAVFVTTDKCYENREWVYGYREEDPLGGHDPYSSSKAGAEIAIQAFRRSFFKDHPVRIASARAGNVIGGGDWARDRIVPDCIRRLREDLAIEVRNPAATRPWQHVLEPLSGYLWLGAVLAGQGKERLNGDESLACTAFNFGPGPEANRTVAELVDELLQHWPGRWVDASNPFAVHEANLLHLCGDKARRQLKWSPVWQFEEAIAQTALWYRASQRTNEAELLAGLTRSQIAAYSDCARKKNLIWAKAREIPPHAEHLAA